MSMFSEAMRFFHFVSPLDFFFGTEWNPGFSTSGNAEGSYGLLPLLWGTLMVSGIALLVAVPVGLMIAIYLAEYASSGFAHGQNQPLKCSQGFQPLFTVYLH
jgi:phosphate transport system permease protein